MDNIKKDYCNNCGNYGHTYGNCRHPILSYGVILYNYDKDGGPSIVLVERKDSLSYIEFMRGKYKNIYEIDYIKLLFSRFSKTELDEIDKHDFDILWKKLWIHTETINPRIKREYRKSKSDFNKLKKGYKKGEILVNIKYLVDNVNNPYIFNEWEIPKGRRNLHENNRECALREFYEETNVEPKLFKLYKNIIPIVEEYVGINHVRYKHVYYIGNISKKCELIINKENRDQYTEIKDIKWCNEEEALKKIRIYDDNKKKVIINFFEYLRNHKNVVTLE
jgi:8-oxo-dGTP pyrophosphatase MutT (NUDIX family)